MHHARRFQRHEDVHQLFGEEPEILLIRTDQLQHVGQRVRAAIRQQQAEATMRQLQRFIDEIHEVATDPRSAQSAIDLANRVGFRPQRRGLVR